MFSWISGNGAQPAQSQSEGLRALSRSSLDGSGTVSRDSADKPPSRQLFTQLNVAPADAKDIVQQRADFEEQRANEEEQLKTLHKDKSPLEEDGYGLLTMRIVYAWDAGNSALFWTHHGIEYEGSYRQDGVLALVHAIALFCCFCVFHEIYNLPAENWIRGTLPGGCPRSFWPKWCSRISAVHISACCI